jgi:hypothetical protein
MTVPVARQPARGSGHKGSRSLRTSGKGPWQRADECGDGEQPPAQSEHRVIFFILGRPLVKTLLPKPCELRRRQAFANRADAEACSTEAACPASKANRLVRLIKTLTVMPYTRRSGRRLKKLAGS